MRKQTSATGARNGPAGFVDLVGRVKPNGGAPLCRNAEILKSSIRVQFPTSFFVYFCTMWKLWGASFVILLEIGTTRLTTKVNLVSVELKSL